MSYYQQKAKYAYDLFLQGKPFKKVYAVVQKGDKYVVLHNKTKNSYQLSGGGVDKGEDNIKAIKREIVEELNMQINIIKSLGTIKYFKTWRYEGKEFDVDYEAEIFYTSFVSYENNTKFGIEGEFDDKKIDIVEISKETMLQKVAEFTKFGLKFE